MRKSNTRLLVAAGCFARLRGRPWHRGAAQGQAFCGAKLLDCVRRASRALGSSVCLVAVSAAISGSNVQFQRLCLCTASGDGSLLLADGRGLRRIVTQALRRQRDVQFKASLQKPILVLRESELARAAESVERHSQLAMQRDAKLREAWEQVTRLQLGKGLKHPVVNFGLLLPKSLSKSSGSEGPGWALHRHRLREVRLLSFRGPCRLAAPCARRNPCLGTSMAGGRSAMRASTSKRLGRSPGWRQDPPACLSAKTIGPTL